MPFIGLIITSIGFTIPSFLAFRQRKRKMGILCSVLSCTSVLYHGTLNRFFKYIDLAYAHSVGGFYIIQSVARCCIYHRVYDVVVLSGTISSVVIFYFGACNAKFSEVKKARYHMLFHACTQSMMSLHAIDTK